MPEGTLNRTFCLSKIHVSSFFGLFVIFWPKNCHFLAFLAIFGQKLSFFGPKCDFIEFFEKIVRKRDFIRFFEKIHPKIRFYRHFFIKYLKNTFFISIFIKILFFIGRRQRPEALFNICTCNMNDSSMNNPINIMAPP